MRRLIEARAKDLAEIPGGDTGMIVKDLKGRNADQPVYKFDAALVAELCRHEKQAAEELGQWITNITTLCIMDYERPSLWRRNKRKPQSGNASSSSHSKVLRADRTR
jgi:hypothetical protein